MACGYNKRQNKWRAWRMCKMNY